MDDDTEKNETPKEQPEGEQAEQGATAVVNKELCPDCKPGDILTVKVVRVHDDELEIEYQGMESGEGAEEGEPEMAAGPKRSPYSSMME